VRCVRKGAEETTSYGGKMQGKGMNCIFSQPLWRSPSCSSLNKDSTIERPCFHKQRERRTLGAGAGPHSGMYVRYELDRILLNRLPWFGSEGSMDMRHDSSSSDGSLNELVEFLVSPDCQLQVTWCYPLNSEITGGVTG